MNREDAIRIIEKNRPTSGYIMLREALDIAIAALRAQTEAEANEPLTPEQLREMDGEPVWVEEPDGYKSYSGWALVYVAWRCQSVIYFVRANGAAMLCAPLLHSNGKAYRHKPKEASADVL